MRFAAIRGEAIRRRRIQVLWESTERAGGRVLCGCGVAHCYRQQYLVGDRESACLPSSLKPPAGPGGFFSPPAKRPTGDRTDNWTNINVAIIHLQGIGGTFRKDF